MVAEEDLGHGCNPLTAPYVTATNDAGPVTILGIIDLSNGADIAP